MTDQRLEIIIANQLRAGVLLAATVVLAGGIAYLIRHGDEQPGYHAFHGSDSNYRALGQIVTRAAHLDPLAVIQFGLLLLIATPIVRVAFALVGFGLEKDRLYMVITTIVLGVLLYGLFIAH